MDGSDLILSFVTPARCTKIPGCIHNHASKKPQQQIFSFTGRVLENCATTGEMVQGTQRYLPLNENIRADKAFPGLSAKREEKWRGLTFARGFIFPADSVSHPRQNAGIPAWVPVP